MTFVDRRSVGGDAVRGERNISDDAITEGRGSTPLEPLSSQDKGLPASQLARETIIIFDWDDTILPTSWLQRIHNLSGGFTLSHESQALMNSLAAICSETLTMAGCLGTVVIVTNSVPGWVDQSCQLFMPQLAAQMRGLQIIARPMRAPLTFKTSAFQREFRQYRNLISVGDGNAERTASLRLQMGADLGPTGLGSDMKDMQRSVKSVKLIELPSCQQLYAEHEMLHQRLADIIGFRGHLDLKARFPPGSAAAKAGACTLVHFARPISGTSGTNNAAWPNQDDNTRMQGLLSLRTITPASRGIGGPASPTAGRQLPLLGSTNKQDFDIGSPLPGAARVDRLGSSAGGESNTDVLDGGTEAADKLSQAFGGGGSGGAAEGGEPSEADVVRSPSVNEERNESRLGRESPERAAAERSNTPLLSGGLWKVQGIDSRGSRSPYTGLGKKRPVLASGLGARGSGAVWRENSAPAATRGF